MYRYVLLMIVTAVTCEDLTLLRAETYGLGKKLEMMTESLGTVIEDLNNLIEEKREAAKKDESYTTDDLAKDVKKRRKEVTKCANNALSKVKDARTEKYKKLEDLLKEKGCGKPRQEPVSSYEGAAQSAAPLPDPCSESDDEDCRRNEVVEAMRHSWRGYRQYAWGWDELMPLSKRGKNWAKGVQKSFGLTIHDALSTLWLMGLKDEFQEGMKWLEEEFDPDLDFTMSAFESVIRMVGGGLSAYELSGEKYPVLLKTARAVADRVLHAYNTSSGIPHASINFATRAHGSPPWTAGSSVLSEFGTVQLELRTLSHHTKDATYDQRATWIMDIIESVAPHDYLCPTYLNTLSAKWTSDHVTLGALGDSFFEYLLKQYLLTGKTETRYRKMYEKAAKGIMKKLVHKTKNGLSYLAEYKRGGFYHKMDHLACFAGGMLALGVTELERDGGKGEERDAVLQAAEEITETCYEMYHKTVTGVAPEMVEFREGEMFIGGRASYYLLRPETVESFFYLWRITKKEKYREWGWTVFMALKRWCRVPNGGYTGLRNIGFTPPQQDDLQQSFWLAETLKYLFLLFSDDDALDLSEWVLNTEAHPMKIRKRDPLDEWPDDVRETRERDLHLSLEERFRKYSRTVGSGEPTNLNSNGKILTPYRTSDGSSGSSHRTSRRSEASKHEDDDDPDDTPAPKKKHHVRKRVRRHRKKEDSEAGSSD
eukprot:TRINITY_DN8281_c0_g1_i1.p1 TRINITY_DN8281_c0_g1~~TRINITY_DN8281_c0_g1_i1.p1  ORF type:complete len:709 (+),score=169.87 TRINITY_DN8281_c0_g1_i1:1876-4002(+)